MKKSQAAAFPSPHAHASAKSAACKESRYACIVRASGTVLERELRFAPDDALRFSPEDGSCAEVEGAVEPAFDRALGVASTDELVGTPAGAFVKRCATLRSSTQQKRSAVRFQSAGAPAFCRRPRATSIETNCPAGLDGICACATATGPNRYR